MSREAPRPGRPPAPRVVIVDAHPMVLLSAGMVLDDAGIEVVAATADLELAKRLCRSERANVVVVDPHLHGRSFRATIAALRLALGDAAIVAMTMESDPVFARATVGAGALGYVLKSRADDELVDAVRAAVAGRAYLSPAVAAARAARHRPGQLAAG